MTPEGKIKRDICDWLSWKPFVFFWVQESVGQWDAKKGIFRKKRSKYQRNGTPDIHLLYRFKAYPPVFVGLEVKDVGKSMNENQKQFKADLDRFGSYYFVVRSVSDVQKALNFVEKDLKSRIELTCEKPSL
jgi:hypothetical protein